MESNGYKVKIKMEMPDKTVKEVNSLEEFKEYTPALNEQGMKAIGAVPVKKKDKSA